MAPKQNRRKIISAAKTGYSVGVSWIIICYIPKCSLCTEWKLCMYALEDKGTYNANSCIIIPPSENLSHVYKGILYFVLKWKMIV